MTRIKTIPDATYRLQFNSQFTFRQATALISYLHRLGISHCYASPYLKARPGSMHGYDIVDHNVLNPEIGSEADYERFVAELRRHRMGLIADIVPNHMGIMGSDNNWWLDVLENGPASAYAAFFDIDWHPVKKALQDRLLIPILGDHYGNVLEQRQLTLKFDAGAGEFSVYYYQHRFPIDPRTYPILLNARHAQLLEVFDAVDPLLLEYQTLENSFNFVVILAPRLIGHLLDDGEIWASIRLELPADAPRHYYNVFTDEELSTKGVGDHLELSI